ncbi:Cinnamoyl-CoA reductase-like SNL6 [Camellia lanceoleosa]|uniref:Cinnamoyl-CoA reductase-like SNL6 n=1 Tax=Camellia lanceoleosa TaxID=1840588 RepID=A0ACC0HIN2_9ERIC|nr:Cinnamoyl-CoA reductase-like SNL6 [Camellia lanceoleosa]
MKEIDSQSASTDHDEKPTVCVLDASTYVGFWILKRLLSKGYTVHAATQKNGQDLYSPQGYDDKMIDLEVRGAINVVEACAQAEGIEKIVFNSSLTAAIWRENICSEKDVDERSWSDHEFCRKTKLWYALAKTRSEQAAWALPMDQMLNMASINAGLVLGPGIAQKNPQVTMSYLKGAAQLYENGVLAIVDVNSLADANIRAFEDPSTCGRYFCFNQIVNTQEEAVKLAESLSPLISLLPRYECRGSEVYDERLKNKKLNKLVDSTAN